MGCCKPKFKPFKKIKKAIKGLTNDIYTSVKDFAESALDIGGRVVEEAFALLGIEGETIYSIGVGNTRIIPDQQKGLWQKIIFQHTLNGASLIDMFQFSNLTGIAAGSKRFLRYGKNEYVNGIPLASDSIINLVTSDIQAVIESIEGVPVTISSDNYFYLSPNEWAKWVLQETTNFTYYNNQLIVGADIYAYASLIDVGGSYTATFNKISGDGPLTHNEPGIPIEDKTHSWIQVAYALDSAITERKIWMYDTLTNVYPQLDQPTDGNPEDDTSDTYPIVSIRKNFTNLSPTFLPAEYASARAILKKIEINIDQMLTTLDGNPDIDLVRDANILFALNFYTESVGGLRALDYLFETLEATQETDKIVYDTWTAGSNPPPNIYAITEGVFNTTLQYNYVDTITVLGNIGNIGDITTEIIILANTPRINPIDPDSEQSWGNIPQSQFILRKQISATAYNETLVSGPFVLRSVNDSNDDVIGVSIAYLELPGGANRDIFSIPLSQAATAPLTPLEVEELFYECLILSTYAVDKTKLKWYETQQFFFIVQIVMVVITVVSAMTGPGASVSSVLWSLLQNVLYQYALSLLLKELLKLATNNEQRIAILIAGTAASIAGPSVFNADFSQLNTAATYLGGVTAVSRGLNQYTAMEAEKLSQKVGQFSKEAQERQAILDDANAQLNGGLGVDPLTIINSTRIDSYETPTNFYLRTTHVGNPGVISLDEISGYHSRLLELPQLN